MTRIIGLMPVDLTEPLVFYKKRGAGFEVASQSDVAAAQQLLILVPSTEVGIYEVSLPTRSEREARRAAPYAIEDELAVPAEDVHIALGPKLPGSTNRELHVYSSAVMDAWLKRIEDNKDLRNAQLVADASVIPAGHFAIDLEDRILGRKHSKRFAIETSMPDDVLNAIFMSSKSQLAAYGVELSKRLAVSGTSEVDPKQALLNWAHGFDNLINLRQGSYAVRRRGEFSVTEWRVPAGLAAAAVMAWLSTVALENRALGQLTERMNATSRSIYTSAFPDEPVPRNIIQAVRNPENLRQSIDFRSASAVLYAGVEAIGSPGIQSLRYDEVSGVMRARISYENFGDEQLLKDHIEKAGVNVRIGEMRQQSGRVSGEITLELAQ